MVIVSVGDAVRKIEKEKERVCASRGVKPRRREKGREDKTRDREASAGSPGPQSLPSGEQRNVAEERSRHPRSQARARGQ